LGVGTVLLALQCTTLCWTPSAFAQTTWHVDATNGNDANAGAPDWEDAFATLQRALDEDLVPGDIILVAEGTYVPSVQLNLDSGTAARKVTFVLPEGVTIRGGYPAGGGAQDPAANPTILSGDLGGGSHAYHVVVIIATDVDDLQATLIDGFTISGGSANENSGANSIGGGAYIHDQLDNLDLGPQFRRCIFQDNFAKQAGGALLCRKTGVLLRDCLLINNSTEGAGEGFNEGGGAVSALGVVHAVNSRFISNNCTAGDGGAIHNGAHTTKAFNCEFRANTSYGSGGAVYSSGTFVSCLFVGNAATGSGSDGGGLAPSGAVLKHCTLAHNDADDVAGGAASPTTVQNSIFWKNSDGGSSGHGAQFSGNACPTDSIIEDFSAPSGCSGTNVLDVDPEFYDIDGADDTEATVLDNLYHLRAESSGVDSGNNSLIPDDDLDVDDDANFSEDVPLDLSGLDRVLFTTVDRGSYEFTCLGDIVNTDTALPPPDGIVDGADLAVLIGDWSAYSPPCGSDCISDIVDSISLQPPPDGVVDGADLAVLLGN